MRIVDIREIAVPLNSTLRNAAFDFSEMTTSVVAVVTDVLNVGDTKQFRVLDISEEDRKVKL